MEILGYIILAIVSTLMKSMPTPKMARRPMMPKGKAAIIPMIIPTIQQIPTMARVFQKLENQSDVICRP